MLRKENKMEKVSVIIPIYNAEKRIGKCLDSILNQTYNNFEIVCVNDGSTDSTENILKLYSNSDSRIIVINKKNEGASTARNVGIENSTGKYIVFVDADDTIEENMIKRLVEELIEKNTDMVLCNFYYVNHTEKIKNKITTDKTFISRKQFLKKFHNYYIKTLINSPWNKLYVKDKISDKFDSNLILGEDLDFNIKYLNQIEKVSIIDEYLYNYTVQNSESITSKFKSTTNEYFCMYLKMYNDLFYNNKVTTSLKFDLFFMKDYIAHFCDVCSCKKDIVKLYKPFYKDIHTFSNIDKLKKRIIFSRVSYLIILSIYFYVKKIK